MPSDVDAMKMDCYVINLEASSERMQTLMRLFDKQGIEFSRLQAVDGRRKLPRDFERYDAESALSYMGREMLGGEIGCYLSHVQAMERFLASSSEFCVVLEDDVDFLVDIKEALAKVVTIVSREDLEWKLINIGFHRFKISTLLDEFRLGDGRTFGIHAAHYFPMTASCLVWSRRGAREFLSFGRTVRVPFDNELRRWLTRTGHGYAVWPPLASTTAVASEIAPTGATTRQTYGRTWRYGWAKQKRMWQEKLMASWRKLMFKRQNPRGLA